MDTSPPLLDVRGLSTHFFTDRGRVRAVEDVSFSVSAGEVVAVVGESGSGKSVTSLSLMGLIPSPPGQIVNGQILLGDQDLVSMPPRRLQAVRGNRIAMIFQDPMTSLDPVFRVEDQMIEAILHHRDVARPEARDIALAMLERVHIPDPARRLSAYPFELSGGLRQRVMIAMALCLKPQVLIADEPTTALDVTVQAQILRLLEELQDEFGMGIILITHDFGVVERMADRVVVMYAGRVVETATIAEIRAGASHPYTRALLASRPRLGQHSGLSAIPGLPPNLANPPPGCPFANRCSEMVDACWLAVPELKPVGPDHYDRCIRNETVS